jgi:hypothetical protein
MIEAIEVVYYNGKILCAFPTREECKDYVRNINMEIDPFDIEIKTQYLTENPFGPSFKRSGVLTR